MGERLGFMTAGIYSEMDFRELFLSVNGTAKRLMLKNIAKRMMMRFMG